MAADTTSSQNKAWSVWTLVDTCSSNVAGHASGGSLIRPSDSHLPAAAAAAHTCSPVRWGAEQRHGGALAHTGAGAHAPLFWGPSLQCTVLLPVLCLPGSRLHSVQLNERRDVRVPTATVGRGCYWCLLSKRRKIGNRGGWGLKRAVAATENNGKHNWERQMGKLSVRR